MSLFIEVYVGSKGNKKLVASCHAYNVSDLAKVSDYKFTSLEYGEPALNIVATKVEGEVKQHNRLQSVWSLVEKIANDTVNRLR